MRFSRLLATFLFTMLFVYSVSAGDPVAGEARYKQSCINCHGMAGKVLQVIQKSQERKSLILQQCLKHIEME